METKFNKSLSLVEKGGFRILSHNGNDIGAVNIENPDKLYGYPQLIYHIIEQISPKNIFMIGHGVGTLSRAFIRGGFNSKVIEIDEEMYEISRKYFGFDGNTVMIGDGFEYLQLEHDQSLGVVVVDAFIDSRVPRKFLSTQFLQVVTQKLLSDGFLIMNFIGKSIDVDNETMELTCNLQQTFPHMTTFTNVRDKDQLGNFIFVAGQSVFDKKINTERFFQV